MLASPEKYSGNRQRGRLPPKALPDVEIREQSQKAHGEGIDIANHPSPATKLAKVELGPDQRQVLSGASVEDRAEWRQEPIAIHVAFERVDVAVDEFDIFGQPPHGLSPLGFEGVKVLTREPSVGVETGWLSSQTGAEAVEPGSMFFHTQMMSLGLIWLRLGLKGQAMFIVNICPRVGKCS